MKSEVFSIFFVFIFLYSANTLPVGLEPCVDIDKLIPDPQNCSRFYECTLNGWVGFACYPGLSFNPDKLYCDYPENVECSNGTVEMSAGLEPCVELDKLIPDPKNCSRFYECTLSGWVGEACNPGLEFNPDKLYCDYPQNVKCANESVEYPVGLEPCVDIDKLIPDPQNCSRFYECTRNGWVGFACYPGLSFNPDKLSCDYPENVECSNGTVEMSAGLEPCVELDKLIPDPKNCSRFYECTLSGWVGEPCNPGLEFNPDKLYCDYPQNVKCANESVEYHLKNEDCGDLLPGQIKPDLSNCSQFIQCAPQGLVTLPCPKDLFFNPETLLCDYPENVNCSSVPIQEGLRNQQCDESDWDKLFPDASHCGRFWQCSPLGLISLPCPKELRFNPQTLLCDLPENVQCKNETTYAR